MTRSGPKLGSGYAHRRAPSKAAVFLRRWWWAGAVLIVVGGATYASVWKVQQARGEAAAEALAKQYGPQLYAARECARTYVAKEYQEMVNFTASLTDGQIEALARGKELSVNALSAAQQRNIEIYTPRGPTLRLHGIRYMERRELGAVFQIVRIRTSDGSLVANHLYGLPLPWILKRS